MEVDVIILDENHMIIKHEKKGTIKRTSIAGAILCIWYLIMARGNLYAMVAIIIAFLIAHIIFLTDYFLQNKTLIEVLDESITLHTKYRKKAINIYSNEINAYHHMSNNSPRSTEYHFLLKYKNDKSYGLRIIGGNGIAKINDFFSQYCAKRNITIIPTCNL